MFIIGSNLMVNTFRIFRVERAYGVYLELEGIEHTDAIFEQYLLEYHKDICPGHGVITYVEGKVKCSEHTIVEDDVPFL